MAGATTSCSTEKSFQEAPLREVRHQEEGIFELRFAWTGPLPRPGQFFLVRPTRTSVLLGRPLSVYGATDTVDFLVARRGRGSAELADLRPGQTAELSGPLGNSWPIPPPTGKIALVGGGIGIAPLVFLADSLSPSAYDFYAGFRARPFGLQTLRAANLVIATEDGSVGHSGRIPAFLDTSGYTAVYACGPEAMLRAVSALCALSGTPCFLSLERRMACGVGACLGCTVRTTSGNRRCCVDGPVFAAQEVLFD